MDVSLLAKQRRDGHMLLGRTRAHEVSLSASVEGPFQLRHTAGIKAHNVGVLGPSTSFLSVVLAVFGPMARPVIQGTVVEGGLVALAAEWTFFANMSLLVRAAVAFVFAASFFLFLTVWNSSASFTPLKSSNENSKLSSPRP